LSEKFVGFITMVLKKSKTWSWYGTTVLKRMEKSNNQPENNWFIIGSFMKTTSSISVLK
jgi:hypothetical protein